MVRGDATARMLMDADQIAQRNLTRCGISEAEQLELARECFYTVKKKLRAKKSVVVNGELCEVEDNANQLRAAEIGSGMVGVSTTANNQKNQPVVQVNVIYAPPDWARPDPSIEAIPSQVIDSPKLPCDGSRETITEINPDGVDE